MIVVGKLAKYKTDDKVLAQITRSYNKRSIDQDYNCQKSVAIIGMVKLMYLSGDNLGKERAISSESFYHFWEVIDD